MNEPVEVIWSVEEKTRGLSEPLIWGLAVRKRRNEELTRLLDLLEINGACNVVVFDGEGREVIFPCELPSRQLTGLLEEQVA